MPRIRSKKLRVSVSKHPRAIGAELVQDMSSLSAPLEGFTQRHRHRIKTRLEDGSNTDVYVADYIDRKGSIRDAIVVLPYERSDARVRVLLRRQFRYAAFVARGVPLVVEAIAGLIDDDEPPSDTVVKELWEEAGISISKSEVAALGEPWFSVPGIMTERMFPFSVEVAPGTFEKALQAEPVGDGSPFEAGAELLVFDLEEALALRAQKMNAGITDLWLGDAKTEILLWRLQSELKRGSR